MNYLPQLTIALTLVVASTGICKAQSARNELASKLSEICDRHDVPGMAFTIVNSQGTVQSGCVGTRHRGFDDPISIDDKFSIGSNTKSMTATLAAVLVDEGKIDWSTTIGDVWPKASSQDLHPKLRSVTLEQLLSHQSGMAANVSELDPAAWSDFFKEAQSPVLERRQLLSVALASAPTQPQNKFAYSNMGYAVASAMLETRARQSFESLMQEHLFDQLGMRSAEFRTLKTAKQMRPPFVWGHKADGTPIDPRTAGADNPSVYAAAGTVRLNIEDHAKYAQWLLRGKPEPVLKTQASFDHLQKPLVDHTSPGAKYACGWICVPTPNGPALNHAGSNTNMFSLIWVLPESDFAVIVNTNTGQPQAFAACDEMVAAAMSKLPQSTSGPSAKSPDGDDSQVDPKRLVGRYQLTPNFIFDVKLQGDRLMVGITNQPTQQVFADSPTKWSYRGVKAQLEFHVRGDAPAYALTLHQNGISQRAKRLSR